MKATGRSLRRHAVTVSLAGALVAMSAVMAAGPAAARGVSTHSHRVHTYAFDAPTSAAVVGADLFVTNGANNSVTEVKSSDGSYVATISGRRFGFDVPVAIAAAGNDLFVANSANDSVTEFRASGHKHLRTIRGSSFGFADPLALAVSGQDLFVLNGAGSITEVAVGSGALIGKASGPVFGFDH